MNQDPMENRRNNYRHSFSHGDGPAVELTRHGETGKRVGRVVDLSVGGATVQLHRQEALPAPDGWLVRLLLAPPKPPLILHAVIVRTKAEAGSLLVSLRFLPLVDPTANEEREQILWRYLLEAQCKDRKRVLADAKTL